MAYTQDDLDNLDRAISSGTLRATIDGNQIEYRSLDDMMRLRQHIEGQIRPLTASTGIKIGTATFYRTR